MFCRLHCLPTGNFDLNSTIALYQLLLLLFVSLFPLNGIVRTTADDQDQQDAGSVIVGITTNGRRLDVRRSLCNN